jgi:hypothetical protein
MNLASQQSNQPAGTNQHMNSGEQVPHRPLGKTGITVSAIALGGYHLGSTKD